MGMQKHEYLDKDGWRYEWIDGVLQTQGVPPERIKNLGSAKPLAVALHHQKQQSLRK